MSSWKQWLIDTRKDVLVDALKKLCRKNDDLQNLIPVIKTCEEAEEFLRWAGHSLSPDSRLIWHLVGTIHQNFLCSKPSLLAWATEHEASAKMRTRNGGTLLHECVDATLVTPLIEWGVDLNCLDQEKRTALQCVLSYGSFDVAWQMIQHDAPLFTSHCSINSQEIKKCCATAATLLCYEYYHTETPPFAPLLWRYLKAYFEWDDLEDNQKSFFADVACLDITPSSWLNEVIDDLTPFCNIVLHEPQRKFINPCPMLMPWHVSCETGLRVTLANMGQLPLTSDHRGKNILHHAFTHYCFPVVEYISHTCPYLFTNDHDKHLPTFYMPTECVSNSYTCFCPDLLLQGWLDSKPALLDQLLSGWHIITPRATHKLDERVSIETYNRLLSEVLRENIYRHIQNHISPRKAFPYETEPRRM